MATYLAINPYVKSVRIRSFSGSYFPAFGLNTYFDPVNLRIQPECEKCGPEKPRIRTLFEQGRSYYTNSDAEVY